MTQTRFVVILLSGVIVFEVNHLAHRMEQGRPHLREREIAETDDEFLVLDSKRIKKVIRCIIPKSLIYSKKEYKINGVSFHCILQYNKPPKFVASSET